MILEIPLTNESATDFQITLDGNDFRFRVRWNETDKAYYFDMIGITTTIVLYGLKMVSGVDLLEPHGFASLGELYIADFEDKQTDTDQDGLGDRYKLLYVPRESS